MEAEGAGLSAGEERHALLRRVSDEMARITRRAFGRGPDSAKSYLFDDMLLIVMRNGLTSAEHTMLGLGQAGLVRQLRQVFQNEMRPQIVGMVEDVMHRKVLTYQSQVMFEPDVVVEMFVFDQSVEGGFVAAEVTLRSHEDGPR